MDKPILILNAGSSSIKLTLFDPDLRRILTGAADAIGGAATLRLGDRRSTTPMPDHASALKAILEALAGQGVTLDALGAVGHRVVHGGTDLTRPTRITPATRDAIKACIPLAPLHNPHNLAAIDAITELAPDLPQVACFDTAFHATNPDLATRYALPPEITAQGIRRYGFHGLSYAALTRRLPQLAGHLPRRLLACHLGNGASLCAIRGGQSVATTMGYSPLEGLTMGTRSGSIDGNAVLHLAEERGIAETRQLLNHQSGLLGLSGLSADMRSLSEAGTDSARFAIDHFCYWAARHAGSLIAAMGGLDAIVFTGGIGENAREVRAGIVAHLGWLGAELDPARNAENGPRLHAEGARVALWVIPADEEGEIARGVLGVLG
ncbi:acetate/propionate family kinase [Natronohydrobacter thiooxidans]|uniref:acetate/propionate family kinase n=1 Tax=Natronohydrobacter thiooxidans TaxID=87172 RepID=UPI0008FF15B6|nr:acetate/propionate family kinase [Natronohydrobacter thiooxidans]